MFNWLGVRLGLLFAVAVVSEAKFPLMSLFLSPMFSLCLESLNKV